MLGVPPLMNGAVGLLQCLACTKSGTLLGLSRLDDARFCGGEVPVLQPGGACRIAQEQLAARLQADGRRIARLCHRKV